MASGRGHGRMSLSMKFIRLLIVLFNLTFVVIGIILLAIGVFVVKDPQMQQLRPLLNPEITSNYSQSFSNVETFAIAMVAIGGILLFIGFLGCCGAIRGFRFLHLLYAVAIGIIIVAEIALVILFVAYQNRFRSELVTKLQASIATYYVGTPMNNSSSVNSVSLSWDFTQFNLKCCGAINKTDFSRAANWTRSNPYERNETNLQVPFTCCPLGVAQSWTELPTNMSSANGCAKTGVDAYTRGCYDRLVDILASYKNNVIIGGILIGLIEILALAFSIVLYRRQDHYNRV